MKFHNPTFIILFALLTACGSISDDVANIDQLEKDLYTNPKAIFDRELAQKLIADYESFVETYPADSLAVIYLFKGAELSMGMGLSDKAVELYNQVYSEYPDYEKAPTSLFLIGFVNETQIKNMTEAQKYYRKFIAEYPAHNLVDDAKFSMNNLGKSDEDIIKEFEAKLAKTNEADTTQ